MDNRGRWRPLLVDVPLAIVVGWLLVASGWVGRMPMRLPGGRFERMDRSQISTLGWEVALAIVVVALGVALRRVAPRTAVVVVAVGTGGFLALDGSLPAALVAPALVVLAAASERPAKQWLAWTALFVPMLLASGWSQPGFGLTAVETYLSVVFGLAVIAVPALVGLLQASRREAQAQARADELRRATDDERLRIAREVHDIVGHSLSLISLQSGVALHVLDKDPAKARESLKAIRDASRESMTELRHVLGVFRDVDDPGRLAPAPGLDRLEELVAALRAAGRRITLTSDPSAAALPSAVQQTAYRVVAEALTNVIRHTLDAAATVEVRVAEGTLLLHVHDDGPPPDGPWVEGNGLRGMRERVSAAGGTLSIGQRGGGGVAVDVTLPVGREA